MDFFKLLKAKEEWYAPEEWDGVEPFDKRLEVEKEVKEKLARLNKALADLDSKQNGLHYKKEEDIVDKLKALNMSLETACEVIEHSVSNKWEKWHF